MRSLLSLQTNSSGCSVWLVPPATHPLHATLTTLIHKTLPAVWENHSPEPLPAFTPHLTLTSGLPESLTAAAAASLLATLSRPFEPAPAARADDGFPAPARVGFAGLSVGDRWATRVHLRVVKAGAQAGGLRRLAAGARLEAAGEAGAREWVEGTWMPHVSLV
jgi:2',3'-cyclic-nucleotide 3'-phosphodiesterase